MKINFKILTVLMLFIAVTSCKDEILEEQTPAIELETPEFNLDAPKFPAIALHLLQREYYYNKQKGGRAENLLEVEFVEERLVQLYPEIAYPGVLAENMSQIEILNHEYEDYLQEELAYEESIGLEAIPDDEIIPLTTLEAEIELTGMDNEEIQLFEYLDTFAQQNIPLDRIELDNLVLETSGRTEGGPILVAAIIYAGHSVWRAIQARRRAESKTAEFYPNNARPGQAGDAFRHIYVSMHLRRYVGRFRAWVIMGGVEIRRDLQGTNTPRERIMDLHNNKIGRATRYRSFRGRWRRDRRDWGLWARNVRNFVNNSSNGRRLNWRNDAPSSNSEARRESRFVSRNNYIWW